ncbi:MAG: hypothetical protein D3910_25175, partial [Candidatus Electrothrix sp. ATG2]|nr:hypothetical protein [Candidatus Electrothrix sp. ATG2]
IPIELTSPPKIHIDFADAAIATGAELVLAPDSIKRNRKIPTKSKYCKLENRYNVYLLKLGYTK